MTTKREYRSEALGAIHETMAALENIGAISKVTMREFDLACLQPVQELKPEDIRALREREHLSQAVFASYLNISKNLVSDWERGKRKPGGSALKLLNVIEKHGISIVAQPETRREPPGYSTEFLIEKWMRDGKINDIYEGTGQVNTLVVAREILGYTRNELK